MIVFLDEKPRVLAAKPFTPPTRVGVAAWFWLSISLVYCYCNTIHGANHYLASILAV